MIDSVTVLKPVGRPRVVVDIILLLELRAQGFSWELISEGLGHDRIVLRKIAHEYLGHDTPRAFPIRNINPVMQGMIRDLQSGFRPEHKQLICYTAFLKEGSHKVYFLPYKPNLIPITINNNVDIFQRMKIKQRETKRITAIYNKRYGK